MSGTVDSVKNIFLSTGLPIGPVMESVTTLQKWFLKRGNKILPISNNEAVDTGVENVFNVESFDDTKLTPGLTINTATAVLLERAIANAKNTARPQPEITAQFLYSVARHLQKHQTVLALALSVDTKRSIAEVKKYDIPLSIQAVYHYAGLARQWALQAESWNPVGVVGIIPSTTRPLLDILTRLCPALVAGNAVVLLPAIVFTRVISVLMDILLECGLHRGSVAFLPCYDWPNFEAVNGLDILHICDYSFPLPKTAISAGKFQHFEQQSYKKSVAVVADSADLESAAACIIETALFSGGKSDFSVKKLFVQESCYKHFLTLLETKFHTVRSGHFLDKAAGYCCLLNDEQFQKAERSIKDAETENPTIRSLFTPVHPEKPSVQNVENISYPFVLADDLALSSKLCTEPTLFPFLAVFPFRTIKEAVTLVNNSGPCASVSIWSENVTVSMEMARFVKADTVWINSALLFDSAICARETAVLDYARLPSLHKLRSSSSASEISAESIPEAIRNNFVDRTYKLYYGGSQKRPDSGNSVTVKIPKKSASPLVVQIPEGNQKDMKSAIDAAVSGAATWSKATPFNRSQILFFIAENLGARVEELVQRLLPFHLNREAAQVEVLTSIERLSYFAGICDHVSGRTHIPSQSTIVTSLQSPLGVIGVAAPTRNPLLNLVTFIGGVLCTGNSLVYVPNLDSAVVALEFCQILETSDVPAGVVNIVTGNQDGLVRVFGMHRETGGMWDFREESGEFGGLQVTGVENEIKVWRGPMVEDWTKPPKELWELFLHQALKTKQIWIPTMCSFAN